ncbi:hypothetical protein IEQ34_020640 [Dendrobium chrysotoxum]|uniref:NAC domain-containing protein n=1 Tax=Dendrobium chrysotoxum TaxID=161865 RepID=A0AAV7G2J3_DENCH|nr:hypothetical protein IEQ34_020640 [Dendrobium chrysotoxum]
MAYRAWLTNCRGIAKKVKNATSYSNYRLCDLGAEANRECPNCQHIIDNSDVSLELPGLPAGVKFDPTDVELLEHLAGKIGVGIAKAHIFIDEFIPTLDGEQGICCTHPENLPGARKDGSSVHFFHRSLNAYSTGNRKRRKICGETEESVRWHKTGKTKPVMENGILKGWKKIMVLYTSFGKGNKPDKAKWVLHQYHLGMDEVEKDGQLVVSKIFYQQTKQMESNETENVQEKPNVLTMRYSPRTPKTMTPRPHRSKTNPSYKANEEVPLLLKVQEEQAPESELPPSTLPIVNLKDEETGSHYWAGESQAIDEPNPQLLNESLLYHEVLKQFPPLGESPLQLHQPDTIIGCKDQFYLDADGFPSLDDIEVDTPPDFQLSDLQFSSQDSWLGRL